LEEDKRKMKIKTILTVTIVYESDELDCLDKCINFAVEKMAGDIAFELDSANITSFNYDNTTEEVKP